MQSLKELASRHIVHNVGDNMVTNLDSEIPATLVTKLKEGCSKRSGVPVVTEDPDVPEVADVPEVPDVPHVPEVPAAYDPDDNPLLWKEHMWRAFDRWRYYQHQPQVLVHERVNSPGTLEGGF